MKRLFLTIVAMMMACVWVQADYVVIDEIRYDVDTSAKVATVIAKNDLQYKGDVVIPASIVVEGEECAVTAIGSSAFSCCPSLTSITIPSSVTTIGTYAFGDCTGLTSVTISEGVISIRNLAFYDCTGLTSVTIPSSVTDIRSQAFQGCTGLTSVTIPSSVTIITSNVFQGCTGLTSVTISEGVTTIGDGAFANCTGLTSLTIPSSVTTIRSQAFQGCTGLTSIIVDTNNTTYDSRESCNAIIETATNTLFKGCQNSFIPSSVTTIGNDAFRGCIGLTSITIPSSVTTIGTYAFDGCTGLTSVISNIISPFFLNGNEFDISLKTNGTLYIPAGTRQAYVEKGWNMHFANIVEMEEGEPIWLSIVDAEQGRTRLKCEAGKSYTFGFTASEGWHVHSVTFRGADVTSWLTEDGEFTTPAMSTSSELVVTYEQGTVGVKAISNDEAKARVLGVGGDIIVKNAQTGTAIFVYDLSGRLIANSIATGNITRVAVPTDEKVVVVKVGKRCVKVAK